MLKAIILMFVSMFHANAISNNEEYITIYEKWTPPRYNYLMNLSHSTNDFKNISGIESELEIAWNRIWV